MWLKCFLSNSYPFKYFLFQLILLYLHNPLHCCINNLPGYLQNLPQPDYYEYNPTFAASFHLFPIELDGYPVAKIEILYYGYS